MSPTAQEVKHIACARCRERKVKCDGSKPACGRCLKNRVCCQYIRGKTRRMRNDWIQHMRTFSLQPEKASVTQTPAPESFQPPLLQGSKERLWSAHETPMPPYATELSPCDLERMTTTFEDTGFDSGGMSLLSSVRPIKGETGTSYSTSLDNDISNLRSFAFDSSSSFHDTSYTSDYLTTSPPAFLAMAPFLSRSQTPMSPASEATTSSYDCILESPYSHPGALYPNYNAVSPSAAKWKRRSYVAVDAMRFNCHNLVG